MHSINRTAVVVKPKQPFVDWIKQDDEDFDVTDIMGDGTIFLISEFDYLDDARKYIEKSYDDLFMFMIEGCVNFNCHIPTNRTYKMFQEWFSYEICSEVFDLVNGLIEKEEV